jgi:transglutaminase superfamily protein/coenzyme PQQ synthesis protein D (PqqD)
MVLVRACLSSPKNGACPRSRVHAWGSLCFPPQSKLGRLGRGKQIWLPSVSYRAYAGPARRQTRSEVVVGARGGSQTAQWSEPRPWAPGHSRSLNQRTPNFAESRNRTPGGRGSPPFSSGRNLDQAQERVLLSNVESSPALLQEREAEYVLPPDVLFVPVEDGSARLLDMAGGFHSVSGIGARILQETLAHGASAAVTRIATDYGVARQRVQNDLAVFLRELEDQGLLCNRCSRRRRRGAAPGLAPIAIRPALPAAHRRLRSHQTKALALLALARLSFALLGWTRTVAVWQEAHAAFPARKPREADAETIRTLDSAVRAAAASHPIAIACKERALCSWSLARSAGLQASLVLAIALYPIAGHCWCEVGAQPLGDDNEPCEKFTPVARW